jgi:hypothetical protein
MVHGAAHGGGYATPGGAAAHGLSSHSSSSSVASSSLSGSSSGALSDRVRVVVRIRPPIPEDAPDGGGVGVGAVATGAAQVTLASAGNETRQYSFDRVLGPGVAQAEAHAAIASDVVDSVLAGYNGTVMSYGQTGAGKTFTIFGPEDGWIAGPEREVTARLDPSDPWGGFVYDNDAVAGAVGRDERRGVIPRSFEQIFAAIDRDAEEQPGVEYFVSISMLQIYMECITDLLDPRQTNMQIREHPETGVFVDGLTQLVVHNVTDALELIREGGRNRAVHTTAMNKVSTRSHVVLLVAVEQRPAPGYATLPASPGAAAQAAPRTGRRGVLTIVDLAGSERVGKSGSEGLRLEEAKRINRSLSALGNCVAALASGSAAHTPFRDSKLTRLLTGTLGGNSRTSLCANIGPAPRNHGENHSTLLFARRAMKVSTRASVNELPLEGGRAGAADRCPLCGQNPPADPAATTNAIDAAAARATAAAEAAAAAPLAEAHREIERLRAEVAALTERAEFAEAEVAVAREEAAAAAAHDGNSSSHQRENIAPASMMMGTAAAAAAAAAGTAPSPASSNDAVANKEIELTAKFRCVVELLKREITTLSGAMDDVSGALIAHPVLGERILQQVERLRTDSDGNRGGNGGGGGGYQLS